jgi:DNA repair protein SbcC/Rad50
MWIQRVTAHAFGPFTGDSLDLAEGLTVITGPNEAGKSSWHAAIYAGLCGMRRGRGRRLKDDEEFAARHEPWDGGPWEVSAIVTLGDGRTVELRHDLGSQVSSAARDLGLGYDITNEIIFDGAPDGSRWLGLDRRAFHAVACVRQAQVLAVTQHAGAIQDHLQRAAATAGTDQTASAALAALAAYVRDHVGLERANSSKPLMAAIRAHQRAEQCHRQAVEAHGEWLRREAEVASLEARTRRADVRAKAAQALRARAAADLLAARVGTARELAERHPEPPPGLAADDELARRVTTAVHAWQTRPVPEPLTGRSAAELREQVAALPPMPEGDLDPDPGVLSARRDLADVLSRQRAHRQQTPPEAVAVVTGGATESELVDLARELAGTVPQVDPALGAEVERLRQQPAAGGASDRHPALIGAAVLALVALVVGIVLVATGQALGGVLALVVAGVGGAVAGAVGWSGRTQPGRAGSADLHAAEARLIMAEQRAAEAQQRLAQARERARSLGLDPDPAQLRHLADQLRRAEHAESVRQQWLDRGERLANEVAEAAHKLAAALGTSGVEVHVGVGADTLLGLVDDYESACRQRRDTAALARQRSSLDAQLEARERAESRRREDEDRVARAGAALAAVAVEAGVAAATTVDAAAADELIESLEQWRRDRDARRAEVEQAVREWSRLQALLDGRRLDDWLAAAERADEEAVSLAEGLPADTLEEIELGADPDHTARALQDEATRLDRELAEARRELAVRAESLVPVAEAAESLDAATAELARVRQLAATLETTQRFMREAQERVHRDIAPVLVDKVRDRLAHVTGGRYAELTVDPQTLGVQVRDPDGRWRDAQYLSQGTAEQVYLLLRVAMAEILTTDSCPLLLDDVTVQSDQVRTRAILEVLHEVSADHQVVLLSQEDGVVAWATEHLGPRDRLVTIIPAA